MNFLFSMVLAVLGLWATPGAAQILGASPSASPGADTAAEFGQNSVDFTILFVKMIFAMLVVIALAVVLIRYVIPKLSLHRPGQSRTDLKVVDRIPLDPKKALYVVEVEGRRILLAVSENHVGLVTELNKADETETS